MLIDTIHCFYLDLNWAPHAELVPFWEERWRQEGWKTRVMKLEDCQKDPRFDAMVAKSQAVPCVNHRLYEKANFIRWLAYSQIDGAIVDYDVFPVVPFPPQEFEGFCCGDDRGGPGFIVGTRKNFSQIADDIINYQQRPTDITLGQPHVSDMIIMHNTKERYDRMLHNVKCYTDPGWDTTPLVHFHTDGINRDPRPGSKKEKIQAILDEIYRK